MAQQEQTDRSLERLVFFSDAVFAIAITLLVIEIHVPHLPRTASETDFWMALARLIPNFVGYAISFGVIGAFWAGHHRTFAATSHHDEKVVPWNLALLGAVAFMPFVTAFMSAHIGLQIPTLVYCGWMVVTALLNLRVIAIATRPPMANEHASPTSLAALRRRSYSVLLGASTALLLTFFIPEVSPVAFMTIPLWRMLLQRLAQSRTQTPQAAS